MYLFNLLLIFKKNSGVYLSSNISSLKGKTKETLFQQVTKMTMIDKYLLYHVFSCMCLVLMQSEIIHDVTGYHIKCLFLLLY